MGVREWAEKVEWGLYANLFLFLGSVGWVLSPVWCLHNEVQECSSPALVGSLLLFVDGKECCTGILTNPGFLWLVDDWAHGASRAILFSINLLQRGTNIFLVEELAGLVRSDGGWNAYLGSLVL